MFKHCPTLIDWRINVKRFIKLKQTYKLYFTWFELLEIFTINLYKDVLGHWKLDRIDITRNDDTQLLNKLQLINNKLIICDAVCH